MTSAVWSKSTVSAMQARFQLSCSLCSQTYGACIQCAGSRQCFAAFHPTCASKEGLRMVCLSVTIAPFMPERAAQDILYQRNPFTKYCAQCSGPSLYRRLNMALC